MKEKMIRIAKLLALARQQKWKAEITTLGMICAAAYLREAGSFVREALDIIHSVGIENYSAYHNEMNRENASYWLRLASTAVESDVQAWYFAKAEESEKKAIRWA